MRSSPLVLIASLGQLSLEAVQVERVEFDSVQ